MLSATSQYALRALSRLARLREGETILGRELARSEEIPSNYLAKILLTLRNAGMVAATRGNGGGYRLTRPASEVTLVEVVELFDGSRARPKCLIGRGECSDSDPCLAHAAWRDVRRTYVAFLESTTLAAISHPESRPVVLLRARRGGRP